MLCSCLRNLLLIVFTLFAFSSSSTYRQLAGPIVYVCVSSFLFSSTENVFAFHFISCSVWCAASIQRCLFEMWLCSLLLFGVFFPLDLGDCIHSIRMKYRIFAINQNDVSVESQQVVVQFLTTSFHHTQAPRFGWYISVYLSCAIRLFNACVLLHGARTGRIVEKQTKNTAKTYSNCCSFSVFFCHLSCSIFFWIISVCIQLMI